MNREEIQNKILEVLKNDFDIENPGLDEDLGEKYEFDSIDAIDMLVAIEQYIGSPLTVEEKRKAVNIRTINQMVEWVEQLAASRQK